jgi:predicted nuclease with TOPRIM domain
MIAKGVSAIRGIRSLNTRRGPITESSGLLKLHQLAVEKESLMKKLEWIKGQKDQTERRLSEIAHAMHALEEGAKRELASNSNSGFRSTSIKY